MECDRCNRDMVLGLDFHLCNALVTDYKCQSVLRHLILSHELVVVQENNQRITKMSRVHHQRTMNVLMLVPIHPVDLYL